MIGRTNTGGGGGGLNFKIIAYATESELLADTAKKNTIGVVTTNKINAWAFSPEQPASMLDGGVWISTGTSSTVMFNALKEKKGAILVCPIFAKQYVSGAWVDVKAKSYQNGKWVNWWNGELYINGNQFEAVTGGWWNNTNLYWNSSYKNSGKDLSYDEFLTIPSPNGKTTCATTRNKIDMTFFNELSFEFASDSSTPPTTSVTVMIHDIESGALYGNYIAGSNKGAINLTGVSGAHYITILAVNGRTTKIGNIRLM